MTSKQVAGNAQVLNRFDNIDRDGVITREEVIKGGGAKELARMWRALPSGEQEELYARLDDRAKSFVTFEVIGQSGRNTNGEMQKVEQLLDNRVSASQVAKSYSGRYDSVVRSFVYVADRIRPIYPELAGFVDETIKEATELVEEVAGWRSPSPHELALDTVLLPAFQYARKKLRDGGPKPQEELSDLKTLLNEKALHASYLCKHSYRKQATSLMRTFERVASHVRRHNSPLADFMRQAVVEAKETKDDRARLEDVLIPALRYARRHM